MSRILAKKTTSMPMTAKRSSGTERGVDLLRDPQLNKSTAFTAAEREALGLYVTLQHRGRVKEVLRNWAEKDVRVICATSGERILGLGDLGANGMGIPIGKLQVYTACAAVPPQYLLPVLLDFGTNNHELLNDPLYLGLRQPRISTAERDELVEE